MKLETPFSNGKWHITVKNVGQLIDELSRLPRDLRVMQDAAPGADLCVYNRGQRDVHVEVNEAGFWDD